MSIFNLVGTPLVVLMVILMIGGAIFGTAVSDSGFLNPDTSRAEAERMNADTTHAQAVYEQEERVLQAQTDAQIAKVNVDSNAYQEQVTQDLAHQKEMYQLEQSSYQRMAVAKENFMMIIGYSLGIAVTLVSLLLGASRILQVMRSTPSKSAEATRNMSSAMNRTPVAPDPLRSLEYRAEMIKQARENERAFRQAIKNSRMNSASSHTIVTSTEYHNLPEAR